MSRGRSLDSQTEPPDEASIVLERSGVNIQLGLLLQAAVFAAVGMLLMLLAPEAPWSIRLLIIALVLLTLKRWGGGIVLLLVQADLYFREGRQATALSGFPGIVFVLLVLMVLMFISRHRLMLQQIAAGSVFRLAKDLLAKDLLAKDLLAKDLLAKDQLSVSDERRPTENSMAAGTSTAAGTSMARMLSSALRGMVLLACCVIVARILLTLVPENRQLTGDLRELVNNDPTFRMGSIVIVAVVAFWVVASEISWRQLTPAQARLYLRTNFLKIHYRDLRMIVMRRLKLRTKRIAASRARGKSTRTKAR